MIREGHEFRDDEGNLICRAARDIHKGEVIALDAFKDWDGEPPKVVEQMPYALYKQLFLFPIGD